MTASQGLEATPEKDRPRSDIEADILRAIGPCASGPWRSSSTTPGSFQIERKEKVRFDRGAHREGPT